MERLGEKQVAQFREEDKRKYPELSFSDIISMITAEEEYESNPFYIRWSKSTTLDQKTGYSIDHSSGCSENGLSACKIDDKISSHEAGSFWWRKALKIIFNTLTDYRSSDKDLKGWILTAQTRGYDNDGMTLLDSDTVEVWGYLAEEDVEKWWDFRLDDDAQIEGYFDIGEFK